MHLDEGQYFGLNKVASHVWELLQQGATLEELVGETITRFDVEAADCERDIRHLLNHLQELKLIVVENATSASAANGS